MERLQPVLVQVRPARKGTWRRCFHTALATSASLAARSSCRCARRARVRDSEGNPISEPPRYDARDTSKVGHAHIVEFAARPFGILAYAPGLKGLGAVVWQLGTERYRGDAQGRARKAGVVEGHAIRRINGQEVGTMDFWDIMDLLSDKVLDNSSGKFQSGSRGPSGLSAASLPVKVELVDWSPSAEALQEPCKEVELRQPVQSPVPQLPYIKRMQVNTSFVVELVRMQREHAGLQVLSLEDAAELVRDVTAVLRAEETLCYCDYDSVVVVGDLHGQYFDLLQIFDLAGWPSDENPYLFNGDFVDRGEHSLEVIFTLFALKLRYPGAVRLNRGNHEAADLNLQYGFAREIRDRYGADGRILFDLFSEAFRWLPLAHVLNKEVFVVHGGLPGPDPRLPFADSGGGGTGYDAVDAAATADGRTAGRKGGGQSLSLLGYNPDNVSLPPRDRELSLAEIASLPRGGEPTIDLKALEDLPEEEAEIQRNIVDLLWADPRGKTGYGPSFRVRRGCYIFGPDVTAAFLKRNGLRLVIRSHEVKVSGYQWTHDNLLTVFSAPNYLGHAQNLGAVVRLERKGDHLEPGFITYRAAQAAR